ncbi:unnamed protein product [Caretta caretta]
MLKQFLDTLNLSLFVPSDKWSYRCIKKQAKRIQTAGEITFSGPYIQGLSTIFSLLGHLKLLAGMGLRTSSSSAFSYSGLEKESYWDKNRSSICQVVWKAVRVIQLAKSFCPPHPALT